MAPGGLLNGPRVRTVQLPILHGCGPARERGPSRSRLSGTRPGPAPPARFPWWGAGWARGLSRLGRVGALPRTRDGEVTPPRPRQ